MTALGGVLGPVPEKAPSRIFVEPTATKYHLLEKGTREMIDQAEASSHEMEQMIGHWVSVVTLTRLYLSIFSSCYDFIRVYKGSKIRHRLWDSVMSELAVALALLPLCAAELTAQWLRYAFAVDASSWGEAAIRTTCSVREVRREAKWAEDRGWYVQPSAADSDLLDRLNGTSEVTPEPGEPGMAVGQATTTGSIFGKRFNALGVDCSEIFHQATRRSVGWPKGDVETPLPQSLSLGQEQIHLEFLGFAEIFGGLCSMCNAALRKGFAWAEAWDSRFGATRDLLLPLVQEELMGRLRRGMFGAIYVRPP
jgi:hypothetical protein